MPAKNKVKAVIWDLDGTLIQFKIDFIKARKAAIIVLLNHGVSKDILSIDKTIIDNVAASKEFFSIMKYSDVEIKCILKEVDAGIDRIEYEAALQATKIKGIDDVLEFVKEKKLKQAIYTYNNNKNARLSLDKADLLRVFDVIVGRDDVTNPKPHPDHLLAICNKLNIIPAESIVIGDTIRDIEGAFNVGAHSIAIRTNLFKVEMEEKADKIVDESEIPMKLIQAIDELL